MLSQNLILLLCNLFIYIVAKEKHSNFNNITANCTLLRDEFAQTVSDFTLCSIYNSRPITLCENCVDMYDSLQESYSNMSVDADNNGTHCIDFFVNLDRLEILETLYKNSIDLWSRAKCDGCFETEDGTQTRKQSNETRQFRIYYQKFKDCINQTDAINLCPNCMDSYVVLQDYYNSISNVNEKIGVCMDVVDLMNTTWSYWSINCCKFRRHNEYIFIGSTVVIFILTIIFYVLTRYCAEKKSPAILQQSRFAEVLNNLST